MGWNISHGTNQYGQVRRSYTSMSNLAQHLAHVLSAREWASISYLFNRGSGDPFNVPTAEASRVGNLLHKAAKHRSMNSEWGQLATELGDAAHRAARAGQNWEWS